jgi:SAM-dependent methyltransferase
MKRKDTKAILDVGCSFGFNSFSLAERFPRSTIVGVDINPENIRVAKEISEVLRYPNLRFLIGDVCEIWKCFEPHVKFDAVLLLETLEHIRDDRKAMISIRDLLHEDSSLYVSVPYSDRQGDLDDRIRAYPHLDKVDDDLFVGGHHHRDGYDLSRIQDLLGQCGLRVTDYHEIPFVPRSKLLFPFLYPLMSHMDSSRRKPTHILVETSLA